MSILTHISNLLTLFGFTVSFLSLITMLVSIVLPRLLGVITHVS